MRLLQTDLSRFRIGTGKVVRRMTGRIASVVGHGKCAFGSELAHLGVALIYNVRLVNYLIPSWSA